MHGLDFETNSGGKPLALISLFVCFSSRDQLFYCFWTITDSGIYLVFTYLAPTYKTKFKELIVVYDFEMAVKIKFLWIRIILERLWTVFKRYTKYIIG